MVPALVAFHSLLVHADRQYRYRLHVLHPGISDRARRRIASVVGRFDHGEVVFHDTSMYEAELASCGGKSHFSKEIYFKLCAPTLFPECDRIICSDVDVVFIGDVSKAYFAYPDEDFYYAGVDTILPTNRLPLYASFDKEEQHWLAREICANFLLLNLKTLRRDDMQRRMTEYYKAKLRAFTLSRTRLHGDLRSRTGTSVEHALRGEQCLLPRKCGHHPILRTLPLSAR